MTQQKAALHVESLIPGPPVATVDQARAELIARVMASQQALSEQFSKIDHPFVTQDGKDDYELARDEFQALIKCSVHMPQSVEGVRFLEGWHTNRMGQIERLSEHARPGSLIEFGEGAGAVPISEEFARGMQAALTVVRALFQGFPLELSISEDEEEAPGE